MTNTLRAGSPASGPSPWSPLFFQRRERRARARSTSQRGPAQQARLRGDAALDAGRPAEALAASEEAFELEPSSVLRFNRARCHERLEQFPEALTLLERFSLEAEDGVRARVPALEALLATDRGRISRLFIEVPVAGVEVRLGERILGRSPLPQPVSVNAGRKGALSVADERFFRSPEIESRQIDEVPQHDQRRRGGDQVLAEGE